MMSLNVEHDLEFNLKHNKAVNKHFAFVVDLTSNAIVCCDYNIHFKTKTFPFSRHAEVQCIMKYFNCKQQTKSKKILIVVKVSKTGKIGNSRCCKNCVQFIKYNFDNLNLKKVMYSTEKNTFETLARKDLIADNFRCSKGFAMRID